MSTDTIDIIKELKALAPVKQTDELFVAISGGIDSVTLAYCCHQAGCQIILVHCNFKLRGEESNRDEALVVQLGEQWKRPVLVKYFDTEAFAKQNKFSIQEAARKLRYDWFTELLTQGKEGQWLLTAHQSDDNAETIAMHFFRGTGLAGLTGIPARNGQILRPLLRYSRRQVEEFALHHELPFVEDSSNAKEAYSRNYFRHTILPALEKVFPSAKQNLLENAARFQGVDNLYRGAVNKLVNKTVKKIGEEFHIPIGQLIRYQHSSLLFEILQPFGFSAKQTQEAQQLLDAHAGAYLQAAHMPWRLIRHRKWMILAPEKEKQVAYLLIESSSQEVIYANGSLVIKELENRQDNFPCSSDHVWIDGDLIQFPLLLRKWKEGDYFYPLGMRKKKKLARFLIDQKCSTTQKEKTWVLESGGRIVWVVGARIDDRFKVRSDTKKLLSLQFIGESSG